LNRNMNRNRNRNRNRASKRRPLENLCVLCVKYTA
jgi:hypothetical protein